MRVPVAIVICIVFILSMVVETTAIRGVHAEYLRRRWEQGQSAAVKIYSELPAGVHAEYRRRRWVESQSAPVKTHDELQARAHLRQTTPRFQQPTPRFQRPTPHFQRPTPHVRPHLRQRNGGNIHN